MNKTLLVLSISTILFHGAAFAGSPGDEGVPIASSVETTEDDADDFDARAFYLAAGGGVAFENFGVKALDFHPRTYQVLDLVSGMFNLRAGYDIHRWIAAEILWEYYTGWDFFAEGGRPRMTELSGWTLTANAKIILWRSRLQPFVLIGAGLGRLGHDSDIESCERSGSGPIACRTSDHDSDEGFVSRYGLGLDAHFTENWRVGIEAAYIWSLAELEGLDWATTGLVLAYSFR
ncbi:MAG TPA: outer membrane beta-barrel protein [Candidatus Binatia bacterium]|nr:outer membrane beta-barrel protein [Candidatus Binatia bacterium]